MRALTSAPLRDQRLDQVGAASPAMMPRAAADEAAETAAGP